MASGFELLLNDEHPKHGVVIVGLLEHAEHFECMVAFAKRSDKKAFLTPLETALARGMTARVAIGLSMYVTDPAMLYGLLMLQNSSKPKLELYLSDTDATFHPKVYAVREPQRHRIIVGSANLTSGGFSKNYEASVVITDHGGEMMASVISHFNTLIEEHVLVRATKTRVDQYAEKYAVHKQWQLMAQKRANEVGRGDVQDLDVLVHRLVEMRDDETESGFSSQQSSRKYNRLQARRQMKRLAKAENLSVVAFKQEYEGLIQWFHSGGLERGKSVIARNGNLFILALVDILSVGRVTPEQALNLLLTHFSAINRAGTNVLTEILHALDNKRFAVMNQNSVRGLRVAGYLGYPVVPSKRNVNGDIYQRFCRDVVEVQTQLGLENLTELDALFNYNYWLE